MRSRLPFPAVALAGCAFKTTAHTEPEQTVVLYACARVCGVTVLGGAGGYFEGYFGGAARRVSVRHRGVSVPYGRRTRRCGRRSCGV